jgi:hypothetical protein
MATPDTPLTFKALQSCALTVHIATKLNRGPPDPRPQALILPWATQIDLQTACRKA